MATKQTSSKKAPKKDSVWHDRRQKSYDRRQRKQVQCKPEDWDLQSYTVILAGLKWVAIQLADGKITHEESNAFKGILATAGDNIKKRLEKHGKWIRKSEETRTVISAELKDCLALVQGSSDKELKSISEKVNTILGGLRE